MKRLGIILAALCMMVCTFLLFFGDTAYQKWQDYNFQSEVKKVVADGDKSELAKNSSVKSGWLGDKYVKVYTPNLNTEQANEIKERLNDATKGLVEENLNFDKDIKEIVFYGVEEKESNFANVNEVNVKKISHKVEARKVNFASESIVSSIYLDKSSKEFTLSSLFSSPDIAKQKFLSKIKQQLAVKGLSEEVINQNITNLRDQDMATWKFNYNNSKFNINIESNKEDINSVEIPVNDLFKYINETYLKGEDLEKYNAKATFFMVGHAVAGNENIIKQVVAEGHQIGNHSWSHPLLTKISLEEAKSQINDTTEALKKASGQDVHIMRPPYGGINSAIQEAVDQSFILWDIDTLDWKNRNTASIMKEVQKTQPGSIILMHDIHQTSIDALPTVLQYLTEQGFELVTVEELMGDQLELHQKYTNRE